MPQGKQWSGLLWAVLLNELCLMPVPVGLYSTFVKNCVAQFMKSLIRECNLLRCYITVLVQIVPARCRQWCGGNAVGSFRTCSLCWEQLCVIQQS